MSIHDAFNQLLPVIGQGRNGQVFKHKIDGDDVAIKVLTDKASFQNEVKFLMLCKSEEFLEIKCICDKKLIIVTPFMTGGCLQKKLQDKSLNTKERSIIAIILASGFNKMHAIGVVHRDIKPSNIVIDQYCHPKIIDMDLACYLGQGITGVVGTHVYMAPEVKLSHYYNEKCDIFAFGVLLFMLLNNKESLDGLRNFQSYPNCPKYTVDLIKMCIDNDPKKRPSFSQIVEGMGKQDNLFETTPKQSAKSVISRQKPNIIIPNSHKRNNHVVSQNINRMTMNQKRLC